MAKKVVVTTIISDMGKAGNERILKTMRTLRKEGFPVVACDFNSPKPVLDELAEMGVEVIKQKSKGPGGAQKEAMKYAFDHGADVVGYTEGDKIEIAKDMKKMVDPIVRGKADIVVPKRSRKTWKSLPRPQRVAESVDNIFQAVTTGAYTDSAFGPRAYGKKAAPYFAGNKAYSKGDWGVPFYGLARAGRDKLKIASVKTQFKYPESVLKEDYMSMRKLFGKDKFWNWSEWKKAGFRRKQTKQVTAGQRLAVRDWRKEQKAKRRGRR